MTKTAAPAPPRYFGPDPRMSRLRAILTALGKEVEHVPDGPTARPLTEAYRALVSELALGPEPEVRGCPSCGTIGMRAATICGNCWTKLTPPS